MEFSEQISVLEAAAGDPARVALATLDITLSDFQPATKRAFEAAAVPHWFDEKILSELLDEDLRPDSHHLFKLVTSLPMCERFVLATGGRYNVHETTRRAVRHRLWQQCPKLFREISARAALCFSVGTVRDEIEHAFHVAIFDPTKAGPLIWKLREKLRGNIEGEAALIRNLHEYTISHDYPPLTRAWAHVISAWSRRQYSSLSETTDKVKHARELFVAGAENYGQGHAEVLLGHLAREAGNHVAARAHYEQALSIRERLAAGQPDDADLKCDVSACLANLGAIATEEGGRDEARRWFSRAIEGLSKPGEPPCESQRQIALLLVQLGDVAESRDDAQAQYQQALQIQRELAKSAPSNTELQRDLAVVLTHHGNLLAERGQSEGAHKAFKEALQISRSLSESDPSNLLWQRDISVSLVRLADVAGDRGDVQAVRQNLDEALTIRQNLTELDKTNRVWQRDLSVLLGRVGNLSAQARDYADAEHQWKRSLGIRRGLSEMDQSNSIWQRDVVVSLARLGDLAIERASFHEAAQFFNEGLQILQRLSAADPTITAWPRDIAALLARLGDLSAQSGDNDSARKYLEEALLVFRKLSSADPTNTIWQRDVSVSLSRLASLALERGDLPVAQRCLEEALIIRRRLAKVDPANVDSQWEAAGLAVRLGKLADGLGDSNKAEELGQEAIQILQRLAELAPSRLPEIVSVLEQLGVKGK